MAVLKTKDRKRSYAGRIQGILVLNDENGKPAEKLSVQAHHEKDDEAPEFYVCLDEEKNVLLYVHYNDFSSFLASPDYISPWKRSYLFKIEKNKYLLVVRNGHSADFSIFDRKRKLVKKVSQVGTLVDDANETFEEIGFTHHINDGYFPTYNVCLEDGKFVLFLEYDKNLTFVIDPIYTSLTRKYNVFKIDNKKYVIVEKDKKARVKSYFLEGWIAEKDKNVLFTHRGEQYAFTSY